MVADILEADPHGVHWRSARATDELLAMMDKRDAERIGHGVVGLVTRRMRRNQAEEKVQRAELRVDGLSGCLRTPAGGSSLQILLVADGGAVRTRQLSARETARLMGLPDSHRLPRKRDDALRLLSDGVVPQVVRHLAATLLEPLLDAADVGEAPPPPRRRPGIKGATRGTTVYLLPEKNRRANHLAIDLGISLHELLLRGLDRMLAEHGQRPVRRYASEGGKD